MSIEEIRKQVAVALEAANEKKALDVTLLQLPHESSTFTDYFLICSGSNPRQVQAIADEVDERLSKDLHVEPNAREGYNTAEWILLDYVDFVVHIFNAQRRAYYDLERLWKSAHRVTPEELLGEAPPAPTAVETAQPEAVPAEVAPAVAKKPTVKKPAAKKVAAKKAVAKKVAVKKAAVKPVAKKAVAKNAVKKAAAKAVKPAAKKKVAAKKVVAKKAVAKKTIAKKAVVKKAATKKVAVKKVAAKKPVAKKAAKKASKRK
jgi:ribosome-associated protein